MYPLEIFLWYAPEVFLSKHPAKITEMLQNTSQIKPPVDNTVKFPGKFQLQSWPVNNINFKSPQKLKYQTDLQFIQKLQYPDKDKLYSLAMLQPILFIEVYGNLDYCTIYSIMVFSCVNIHITILIFIDYIKQAIFGMHHNQDNHNLFCLEIFSSFFEIFSFT